MGSFFDFNFNGVKKVFNIRFFILIIFLVAIIFITIGLVKANYKCPPNMIKYVYIPRSFEEQQSNPEPVSKTFSRLFSEPSPWTSAFTETPDIDTTYS